MNKECINCEWYNKPYWSIISPCTNCTKRFNKKSVTVTHYSIDIDKKELYKEIEQLKNRIDKAIEYCECHFKTMVADEEAEELLEILKGKSE